MNFVGVVDFMYGGMVIIEGGEILRFFLFQDNIIFMSKSLNYQMEEESLEQKRNVDGLEQKKVDNLQWKIVDS